MPNPEDDRRFQKQEFEIIATDLNVPESKRVEFIGEALQLLNFMDAYGGFDQYLPRFRSIASIKLLKKANKDLKKTIDCFRNNWFAMNRNTSIDLGRILAQLLDHPNARSLIPGHTFVTLDGIPQMDNFFGEKAEGMGTEDETSITYAKDPGKTFVGLLDLLQTALAVELQERRKSAGGRPSVWLREYCLKELLALHDKTFDKPATSTPAGLYSNMCHFLFESFDQPTDGLDEAIKRFLGKQSS